MDVLVIIFGIFGWIYNNLPLLIVTIVLSSIALLLTVAVIKRLSTGAIIFYLLLYLAGIVVPLVRILQ